MINSIYTEKMKDEKKTPEPFKRLRKSFMIERQKTT